MTMHKLIVPDLGGDGKATIIEILVKPNDKVSADTAVVTLESDKASMDVPAGVAGVIGTIIVKTGDAVSSGALLMELHDDALMTPAEAQPPAVSVVPESALVSNHQLSPIAEPASTLSHPATNITCSIDAALATPPSDIHAGPAVRKLARLLGVDLTAITGSGLKQRIVTDDVYAYVKQRLVANPGAAVSAAVPALPPLPKIDFSKFGPISQRSLTRIQVISGANLHRNWRDIPHVTQCAETDITELLAYREQYKEKLAKAEIKLTVLVFIIKAVAKALERFPTFNASLDTDGATLIMKHYYHIGVAVETPDGLLVPVLRDVNTKDLRTLAQELMTISGQARNKQLSPAQMQGGCFSISSLGNLGVSGFFTPIINAPEVAILGVSTAQYKPVYQANGALAARMILPLSLSYDHRVIDGAEAARFMAHLAELLGDVRHMLL